jgi:hypothetical protein
MRKEQVEQAIRRCLSNEMSLDDFRQWFAGAYVQIRQDPNASREAALCCSEIVGPLAEFSRGHRSVDSLREILAHAIGPSVGLAENYAGAPSPFPIAGSSSAFGETIASAA